METELDLVSPRVFSAQYPMSLFLDLPGLAEVRENEAATLPMLANSLDELSQKYKNELSGLIYDYRALSSSLVTLENNKQYFETEIIFKREYISNLFGLYRQSRKEASIIKKQIRK